MWMIDPLAPSLASSDHINVLDMQDRVNKYISAKMVVQGKYMKHV